MMLGYIRKNVFNLLENAPIDLCAAGTEYTGWPGITREKYARAFDNTGAASAEPAPSKGWINIFDRPYSKDSSTARPAIYAGTDAVQISESLDFTAVTNGAFLEYQVAMFPVLVICNGTDYYTVSEMLDQLVTNIKKILNRSVVTTFWWEMRAPGIRGGGEYAQRQWVSGTGGASGTAIYEGIAIIPYRIRYQYVAESSPG
jgi:hypothetical protein